MGDWDRARALELLEELLERELEVEADRGEDRLLVGPSERLTDDLRDRIRRWKPELLDVLDPPTPDGPCPDCGAVNYVRRPAGRWRCMECWSLTADEASGYFFGPLSWHREEAVT